MTMKRLIGLILASLMLPLAVLAGPKATSNPKYIAEIEQLKADPETKWSKLTRLERTMIVALYQLAKEMHPALTLDQFKAQLKAIWDAQGE